ncbi:uncharacterized protein LOC121382593 [Gigantopelta aegis]|uniref:uncharacterized protein LOC121382593 n=1 Tax=Gigantopelta aegis TaxID=1735272 RepID=UPI001B88C5C6|nr:uncharacterized protein LOC121382593 [Gigantopelta aegis]XP_041368038.1 uncharacterized protein LOC121382593 [Gigantopelta aegis]
MYEQSKSEVLRKQEQHLHLAMMERSFYKAKCSDAKTTAATHGISRLEPCRPNSKDIHFNYSFDYAQQVHYPADPQQPGPIYFKTPRKCQVFGIHAEGIPCQINYLIDEAVFSGKGANAVISLLHHFLGNYGIGEMHLDLNADNCSGQNKNNCVMWYLCWRTLVGLHTTIHMHFMLAGHTKFAPDWCFGLFKRLFKRTFVSSLAELQDVVNKSTEKGINHTQLVGDQEGNVLVPIYDWTLFLADFFRRFPGIKSHQHFFFSAKKPGVIKYKPKSYDDWRAFTLKKTDAVPVGMPHVINPKGMDLARKAYLFKEIRDFCKDEIKDLVCPKPSEIITESDSEEDIHTDQQTEKRAMETAPKQRPSKRGRVARGTGRGRRTEK